MNERSFRIKLRSRRLTNLSTTSDGKRLEGLDLARYVALAGMVVVNFRLAMGVGEGNSSLHWLASLLEGRAAATFVILAGLGFGLAAKHGRMPFATISKRALFLFVAGLLNLLIFDADILHFYGVYFILGAALLPASGLVLTMAVIPVTIGFVGLTFMLDYEAGWDWTNFAYLDLWSVAGFIRNLFYNGWHPVFPWFAFFAFGMALARLELAQKRHQLMLVLLGIVAIAVSLALSSALSGVMGPLSGIKPLPPGPWFILGGVGTAMLVVGICLLAAQAGPVCSAAGALVPAGRQTLTLYIAHIVIGMGLLEELDMLNGQNIETAFLVAVIFMLSATVFAWAWSRKFHAGPLEMLMRRLTG